MYKDYFTNVVGEKRIGLVFCNSCARDLEYEAKSQIPMQVTSSSIEELKESSEKLCKTLGITDVRVVEDATKAQCVE